MFLTGAENLFIFITLSANLTLVKNLKRFRIALFTVLGYDSILIEKCYQPLEPVLKHRTNLFKISKNIF